MSKIYLHIGFGKCGSSALQASLTQNHEFSNGTENFQYAAVLAGGRIITKSQLTEYAACIPHQYANTFVRFNKLAARKAFQKKFSRILGPETSWILSQEAWGRRAEDFREAGFLKQLGREVTVIAYVRPQVEWLNSACWQWFYWRDKHDNPADCLSQCGERGMDWEHWARQWETVPGVTKVIIRPLPRDIYADFLGLLGCDSGTLDKVSSNNTTLPLETISLLSKMGGTRGPKDSAVDFILQKHIKLSGKKAWAIPIDVIREVIASHRESNESLLKRLDPAAAEIMKNDERWWNPDFYQSPEVDFPKNHKPTRAETRGYLTQAIRGMLAAEKELSQLKLDVLYKSWNERDGDDGQATIQESR